MGLQGVCAIHSKNGIISPLHFFPVLWGNSLKISQYFMTKVPHCILSHAVFLLFQVIETSQYGTLLQIMVIIFSFLVASFWALVPNPLPWNSSVSGNLTAVAVWGCVCVCVIPWCYLLSPVQGFRLICFSIRFLRAIQSPLPAWGCSCMLISQFQQNTHRSLLKYLVFLIQREEVSGLGWVRKAGSGPVAVSYFFSPVGDEDSFPETELWC